METQGNKPEAEGDLSAVEEELLGQPGKVDGRSSKLSRYIKMQNFIPIKDVVALDEMKLRFMKQGLDISRSRLLSEAIRVLAKEVAAGKFELKA